MIKNISLNFLLIGFKNSFRPVSIALNTQKYIIQSTLMFSIGDLIDDLSGYLHRVSYKKPMKSTLSGRSSGVERNLAKVEVEGSNPFARSNISFFSLKKT